MSNPTHTQPPTSRQPINLNTATASELRGLPGVGPALARAILSDREAAGEYARAEDLRRVPGVGPKILARIVGLVCCGGVAASAASLPAKAGQDKTCPAKQPSTVSADATTAALLSAVEAVWSDREDKEEIRPPGPGLSWTAGQIKAIKAIRYHMRNRRGEIFVLRGYAGTGKTTLLTEALRGFPPPTLLAPTHKAKAVLEPKAEILGGRASTVHRWLGYMCVVNEETGEETFKRAGRDPRYDPNPRTPVILDEVSMMGTQIWGEFVGDVKRFGLMCVAMGDPLQLPPVGEAESPAWALPNTTEITEVMRSQGALTDVVLGVRHNIRETYPPVVTEPLEDKLSRVEVFTNKIEMLRDYYNRILAGGDAIVLAWTNRSVDWVNTWIRARVVGNSRAPFVPGEVLVVTHPYSLEAILDEDEEMCRPMLYTETRLRVVSAEIGRHPMWDDACWILSVQQLGFDAKAMPMEDGGKRHVLGPIYALDDGQRRAHFDRIRNMQDELARLNGLVSRGRDKEARLMRDMQSNQIAAYRNAYLKSRPGYATTVHKSQGSTWGDVYAIQGDILKNDKTFERNRLLYVAFSRAAKRLVVYG
jgi:exodeoxyribonuclease-5